MEEKKPIKISLSTFFLILAIIVILIMGVLLYIFYNNKITAEAEAESINAKVSEQKTTIEALQGQTENNKASETKNANTDEKKSTETYNEISGTYDGVFNLGGVEKFEYKLELAENGTFRYSHTSKMDGREDYGPYATLGNYIINGDKLEIHEIFDMANSTTFTARDIQKKLKIQDSNTIIDEFVHDDEGGTEEFTLKKTSNTVEKVDISGIIKDAVNSSKGITMYNN